jgi:hypothetical protein
MRPQEFARRVYTVYGVYMGAKNRANAKTKLPGHIDILIRDIGAGDRSSPTPYTLYTLYALVCRAQADVGKAKRICAQSNDCGRFGI